MKKILLLEKGKYISAMVKNLTKDGDIKIIIPVNGFRKDSQLPKLIPDLVIADLTSIKNEKVELLMHLKNNPVISMVPFLLITSGNGSASEDLWSSRNYYLNKPFLKEDLINLITKILGHTDSLSPW